MLINILLVHYIFLQIRLSTHTPYIIVFITPVIVCIIPAIVYITSPVRSGFSVEV